MKKILVRPSTSQAEVIQDVLICLGPFGLILLVYSAFRGIVPILYRHVHYMIMPRSDTIMFGQLPTVTLQKWLWHGYVAWYDYIFYIVYNLHYVLPLFLAILIFKLRREEYLRFASTYLLASFSCFAVFVLYPTAPPWLAAQNGYIAPVPRIFSSIYSSLGISDFSALYNHYAPNPIAAFPSMHTTYGILFSLFIFRLFGKKWGMISLIYPVLLIFGVVYMGEHYVLDVLGGAMVAFGSYMVVPTFLRYLQPNLSKWAVKLPVLSSIGADNLEQ